MTSRERAEAAWLTFVTGGGDEDNARADFVFLVERTIDAAVAEEREACATLAFDIAADEERCMGACERVGFAIRARGVK